MVKITFIKVHFSFHKVERNSGKTKANEKACDKKNNHWIILKMTIKRTQYFHCEHKKE